jgi:hypothetical protein
MTEPEHPAARALARLCGAMRRAAARARVRRNGSFERMLNELDGYAEQVEGFAVSLEEICSTFGLTCPDLERSLDFGEESSREASREEVEEVRAIGAGLEA